MRLGSQSETPPTSMMGSRVSARAMDKSELVQAVRAGNADARELLFETYADTVLRALARTLGRDPDLGDLLHDVFIAAFEGMHQLQDPEALPGWLGQIAVNVARAHVRRRMRSRSLAELLARLPDTRAHLDHHASEASLVVSQLLGRLPAGQRAPFELRFLAEMELSEVAASCELSLPTVKRRLTAARRRLDRLHDGSV
jgi:RNA polymerase sigma-70 factor (ECF subfamily)